MVPIWPGMVTFQHAFPIIQNSNHTRRRRVPVEFTDFKIVRDKRALA